MPGDSDDDQNLRARMAHLEDEFDRLAKTNQLLQGALANVPGPTRRQALGAAAVALGASAGGVGFLAGQETARADAVGQVGTSADPLTKLWTHEIESGDGASTLTITGSVDAGTVTAEKAGITTPGDSNWTSEEITVRAARSGVISDDATATFYNGSSIEMVRIELTFREGTNLTTAIIHGRADVSATAEVVTQTGGNTVEVTTSDVSGTTGTDGNVTVSIRDGVVEVENRVGAGIIAHIKMSGGG